MRYAILYTRMLEEVIAASSAIPKDDPAWVEMDLSWAELVGLHLALVD